MFFIFDKQEEWTWNISNNYIIKSDVCIRLKYIRILDIYINMYLIMQNQKKKKKIIYQLWKHTKCLTSGSI